MGRIETFLSRIALGVAGCVLMGAPVSAGSPAGAPVREFVRAQPASAGAERALAAHNRERARLGLPPLVWNAKLASDAITYARTLLDRGVLAHSSIAERSGNGENLWMGTAGAWNLDDMIDMFMVEKRYFRAAAFPNVSLTGNWSDVGHYSQIVWRETREVGCAVDTGNGKDVLVCRYFPAGNVSGKTPY